MRNNVAAARVLLICVLIAIVAGTAGQPRGIFRPASRVKTGIDVLEGNGFAPLRGKHVGVITNQTGVDSRGQRTIDALAHAYGVKLVAIFSPEHGLEGRADELVASGRDEPTGLPIYSLYGETRRPTDAMLAGIDALVFDIQDAGVRFYTYVTTLGYVMEEAAKRHIAFYVLDRPDPLDGVTIEGPMLDRDRLSFVGYFPLPVRYAMTIGELATMFNAENRIGADLHVIALEGWHRADRYEETGLRWIPPSPNLRNLDAALLYPGLEILQAGGVSVGRGTPTPFEVIGAPWLHKDALADELKRRAIPGIKFAPAEFMPGSGLYTHQQCEGVKITIADRAVARPMQMGLEIAAALHKMYPKDFQLDKIIELTGSADTVERLKRGEEPSAIVKSWAAELDAFRQMRAKYLLYH